MSSENNVIEYNEKQQLVLQWIESGCDYLQGNMLYGQFGKNIFLSTDFHSKQRKYATKIIYELCKSVGLDYAHLQKENRIPVFQESPIKEFPTTALRVRLSAHAEGSGSIAPINAPVS